jgi:hypothetical protein
MKYKMFHCPFAMFQVRNKEKTQNCKNNCVEKERPRKNTGQEKNGP